MSHHHDQHRPSPPSVTVGADDDGGGPTGNDVMWYSRMSNIYRDDVAAISPALPSGGAVFVRTLCSLLIFQTLNTATTTTTFFKSPGGMSAAALGFPFTWAQWKELERQAMIYKYMAASVPVPSDLLLPFTRNLYAGSSASHSPTLGGGSILNLRFSKNGDSEPGRCKRTDGKKWRCSRDVAPHQKYCERHMNRGRPRSRKPVEVNTNNNKKTRLLPNLTVQGNGSTILPPNQTTLPKTIQHVNDVSYKEPNRGLDWMMEGEMDPSEQQWHHLMQTSASVFQEESLNLGSYTNFGGSDDVQQNGECNLFLNPDLVSLGTLTPRGFIDAWSNENPSVDHHESSVSSNGNLSPSSLTLSMAMAVGNNALDDDTKAHVSSWLSPDSWVPCTGGGPLAEVLRPSTAAMGSNPVSSYAAAAGDTISPPATTVSSPSGVLHRTMLSLSDSSVCNSPTLAASTATPEIVAFQWLG